MEGAREIRIFAASSTSNNTMKQAKAPREEAIRAITCMLQENSFSFDFKVVKKPRGIRVIYEITEEQFHQFMNTQIKSNHENK